jgi:hypothetical protein
VLDAAAKLLEDPIADARSVHGTYDGRTVTISAVYDVVAIRVALDTLDDLLLAIGERSWLTAESVEAGETIDIRTGDATFDKLFHVEGAPNDIVLAALTREVRDHLGAYPRCTVAIERGERSHELVYRHKTFEAAALEPCIRGAINFARSIERARDEVPKLRALPVGTEGFRDVPPTAIALRTKADHEVRQLARMRAKRGALLPYAMAASGAAYVTAVLVFGLPLAALLFALPAALFGGIGLSLLGSAVARGFRGIIRRRDA